RRDDSGGLKPLIVGFRLDLEQLQHPVRFQLVAITGEIEAGDQVLDIIEIVPLGHGFYNYDAKYVAGGSKHILPAEISPDVYQNIQSYALKAHQAMGCRGVSRSDFRYDDRFSETGEIVWLEVNTQPGMTPTSLVPEMAAHAGYSFGELVRWMVEDASCLR
ncbi:MAG: hypothetical protein ACK40W_11390, partial [Allorhizobium sp.]